MYWSLLVQKTEAKKTFALPVPCIPYSGMPHQTLQKLLNGLVEEMVARDMSVPDKLVMHIILEGKSVK